MPDSEARDAHLKGVLRVGQCNYPRFSYSDSFHQHLQRSHAAKIGEWTTELETIYREDVTPRVPRRRIRQEPQGASVAHLDMDGSKIAPIKAYENTKCLSCGENDLHKEDSRRRHIERHMDEVAFAVVSKPYEEWDFYSDSTSKS